MDSQREIWYLELPRHLLTKTLTLQRKSRQIQPSMHCHHSSRASSRQVPFHTQYGSVSKDGNPCQMPEISKARVERWPWSGLAVLRPAGILSAASEAVGDGGCLCQWHSWGILECIWKQSRCQAILWLLQCPPASFHLQHQLGSRLLVHHTLSWSKSSASCLSHPTLCPGLPGSTALQLGSTMLSNEACSQQVLPSGLVKMVTPNALESASQLTMSNYQTQNHAVSNIFLLTKPFPSKTSITMKFSVTLWLMLKLLGISLSAMVAHVSCGSQFPRTASPWNTKGSLPCSLSLQCSCIPPASTCPFPIMISHAPLQIMNTEDKAALHKPCEALLDIAESESGIDAKTL